MEKPQHIMVVDDDESVRAFLTRVLKDSGYDVTDVSSGSVALSLLEQRIPDLVLLDVMMPELTGIEVLKRMNERGAVPPVIVLTGLKDSEILEQAFNLGAVGFLTKPILPAVLLAHVKAKLRRISLDSEETRKPTRE